jgi:periplasmic protein TonB
VVVKHDDPRTGRVTMTLTQVTRAEPDPSLFQIPAGYQPMSGIGSGTTNPQPANTVGAGSSQGLSSPLYHIGGGVSAPRLVLAPDPEFPSGESAGGVVVVACIVDEKGSPQQVRIVRSLSDAFDRNAIHAVEQYRFEPATLQQGSALKPVAVQVNIEVTFRPPA